jgi:hypothetical protein
MNEKPIKIIQGTGKHKTETRVFARNIHETYCVQKGCRFCGQHAAQGVCHTVLDRVEQSYIDYVEKIATEHLDSIRKQYKNKSRKDYIQYLENNIFCDWMNAEFGLSQLVHLRAENAVLKNRLGRKK